MYKQILAYLSKKIVKLEKIQLRVDICVGISMIKVTTYTLKCVLINVQKVLFKH